MSDPISRATIRHPTVPEICVTVAFWLAVIWGLFLAGRFIGWLVVNP